MEINPRLTEKGKRDFKLIQEALEGNQSAYAQLLNFYRDALYFSMLKMTQNNMDAEDLTIEAFAKAFKNLGQYVPEYAFSTWLFKIANNNAIDFIRNRQKASAVTSKDFSQEGDDTPHSKVAGDELDPEEQFIRSQKIEIIHEVVDKLKPHYKKLIELRYFQERTYEEIVQELELPMGTIKAQLFRARELLYNILKNAKDKL